MPSSGLLEYPEFIKACIHSLHKYLFHEDLSEPGTVPAPGDTAKQLKTSALGSLPNPTWLLVTLEGWVCLPTGGELKEGRLGS